MLPFRINYSDRDDHITVTVAAQSRASRGDSSGPATGLVALRNAAMGRATDPHSYGNTWLLGSAMSEEG